MHMCGNILNAYLGSESSGKVVISHGQEILLTESRHIHAEASSITFNSYVIDCY